MFKVLTDILGGDDYTMVEDFELAPSEARFREVPRFLYNSRIGLDVQRTVSESGGLWNHQSVALEQIGEGANVVVSTGTASGKSLVFQSAAFHRALINRYERILVFYPLKALASDQLTGWRKAAIRLELPEGFIGRIDGTVTLKNRDAIFKRARVLLMTPDVCHAWMMSNLANPVVKEFLRNLGLVILDEAHTLEGVFGSNFSFLFRRILAARNVLRKGEDTPEALNVIAATATIANPSVHLQRLTGLEFIAVGESDDGSPHYQRRCVHVASPPG